MIDPPDEPAGLQPMTPAQRPGHLTGHVTGHLAGHHPAHPVGAPRAVARVFAAGLELLLGDGDGARPRATSPAAPSSRTMRPGLPGGPAGSGGGAGSDGHPLRTAGTRARRSARPGLQRAFTCVCGQTVFFRNSACLACGRALGYDPERGELLALEPIEGSEPPAWRGAARGTRSRRYHRCSRLDSPSGCNWLVGLAPGLASGASPRASPGAPSGAPSGATPGRVDTGANAPPQCRCCRLLRTLPDLSQAANGPLFHRVEQARRRLVSSLIALGLPVKSRLVEDPQQGLAFDVLQAPPGGPPVVTGHAHGIVTIDLAEADDPTREQRRAVLGEPYRTLLGHLRHESGHYYWQRLLEGRPRLEAWRECFGDERADYAGALQRHYADGPPADWAERHVSAYASAHPWEDWAETWAHYLHIVDTLDTARSFGLDGEAVELDVAAFDPATLGDDSDTGRGFVELIRHWMELTGVLNELSRSMGVADFYPFVLSATAVRKLHFVHRLVGAAAAPEAPAAPGAVEPPAGAGTAVAA